MKLLIPIFLALVSISASCQSVDTSSSGRFSIGLCFSPDYAYRSLSSDESNQWIADSRNEIESPKFGYTTGLSVLFKLNERISLESGIKYSNKGERIKSQNIFTIDGPISGKFSIIYSYQYIDLPVKFNFFILTKGIRVFVSGGFSANYFLNYTYSYQYETPDASQNSTESPDDSYFKALNLAAMVGFGIDYNLAKNFNLRFEPIFRHSISSIWDAPVKQYPYSLGANIGVFYRPNF